MTKPRHSFTPEFKREATCLVLDQARTCISTRDDEATRLSCKEIEVGMVDVNVPLPVAYQASVTTFAAQRPARLRPE